EEVQVSPIARPDEGEGPAQRHGRLSGLLSLRHQGGDRTGWGGFERGSFGHQKPVEIGTASPSGSIPTGSVQPSRATRRRRAKTIGKAFTMKRIEGGGVRQIPPQQGSVASARSRLSGRSPAYLNRPAAGSKETDFPNQ